MKLIPLTEENFNKVKEYTIIYPIQKKIQADGATVYNNNLDLIAAGYSNYYPGFQSSQFASTGISYIRIVNGTRMIRNLKPSLNNNTGFVIELGIQPPYNIFGVMYQEDLTLSQWKNRYYDGFMIIEAFDFLPGGGIL